MSRISTNKSWTRVVCIGLQRSRRQAISHCIPLWHMMSRTHQHLTSKKTCVNLNAIFPLRTSILAYCCVSVLRSTGSSWVLHRDSLFFCLFSAIRLLMEMSRLCVMNGGKCAGARSDNKASQHCYQGSGHGLQSSLLSLDVYQ